MKMKIDQALKCVRVKHLLGPEPATMRQRHVYLKTLFTLLLFSPTLCFKFRPEPAALRQRHSKKGGAKCYTLVVKILSLSLSLSSLSLLSLSLLSLSLLSLSLSA